MLRRNRPVISRRGDGTFSLRLSDEERALLAELANQLEDLVDAPDDPLARRLFPMAYPDDERKESEYRLLAGEELRSSQRAALETLRSTASATVLTTDEAGAWLRSINSIRLVLGTRLDVQEDDGITIDPEDPDAQPIVLYHYLSFLADTLVQALSRAL